MDEDDWQGPAPAPTFTMVPDRAFDRIMRHVSPSEWKVLCCLMRATYGWRRPSAEIALPEIADATGLGRSTIINAIKALEGYRLVEVIHNTSEEYGQIRNTYRLLVATDDRYTSHTPVQNLDRPPAKNGLAPVQSLDPSSSLYTERRTDRSHTQRKKKEDDDPDRFLRGKYGHLVE